MLRLSKDQQKKLGHSDFERFIEDVRVHLEQHFPRLHDLRGADKTRAWIRYDVEQAEGYDIVEDRDVRRFIDLSYARGIGFEEQDEHSWIRDILTNEERTGRWKMDQIQDGLSADGSEH